MKDDDLRRAIFNNRDFVESIMLTEPQFELLKFITEIPDIGSKRISNHFSISMQSASVRLKRLVEKGYIIREKNNDPTGGKYFLYKAINMD